jgi:hypothetical protein
MPRRKKGEGPKDPFEELPAEFRDTIAALDRPAIRERIAQIALDQAELMEAKENDEDFQRAREASRDAGAIYREGTKMNKLKITYAKRVLEDKGG